MFPREVGSAVTSGITSRFIQWAFKHAWCYFGPVFLFLTRTYLKYALVNLLEGCEWHMEGRWVVPDEIILDKSAFSWPASWSQTYKWTQPRAAKPGPDQNFLVESLTRKNNKCLLFLVAMFDVLLHSNNWYMVIKYICTFLKDWERTSQNIE